MPSSINASTTAGLVNTADTSGVLQLQTAGTTAVTVNASQVVSIGTTNVGGTLNTTTTSGNWGEIIYDLANNASMLAFRNNAGSAAGNISLSSAGATSLLISSVAGVNFPATQVASTDANTLDDYEEGSCTLVISDSSGNNATMGGGNVFRYIKIGRMVSVSGTLSWDSVTGVTTSRTRITGLPFAASSVNAMRWPAVNGSSSINSFNITRSEIAFGLDFNNAFLWGTKVTGNNLDNNLDINSFGTSGTMYGLQVTYFTEN
jgi:hypothetical protein